MSLSLRAKFVKGQGVRCPCHNILFLTYEDYNQHLHPVAFGSVGAKNYQEWIDTLDIHAPKPKIIPPPPNYTLRRLTESYKHKKKARVFHEHEGPQTARLPLPRVVSSQFQELSSLVSEPGVLQNFLLYLHSFGTLYQQDELAPTALDEVTLNQLQQLFDAIDVDHDGLISANDLTAACEVIGTSYNPVFFRKIDKTRKGTATFPEVVKAFFPQLNLKKVTAMIQKLSKPPPVVLTTRQQLAPEHLAEIGRIYHIYSALPGGCTLENMLSQLSSYQRERADAIAETFAQFDSDHDGVLSLEDYTELVKCNYPPFRQSDLFPDKPLEGVAPKSTAHPLNKDRRIFFPKIKDAVSPLKAFGSSELLAVKAGVERNRGWTELEQKSTLLHISPLVRHVAGDIEPR